MHEVGRVVTLEPEEETGRPVVLQVLPALVTGGVERSAVDIAQALRQAGGTAIVASEGGPLELELQRAGAIHVKLPLASKNPLVMARNVKRLTQIIDRHDVDIVHARSRAPAWSAFYAARRRNRPFVTTFHGTYNFGGSLKKQYNAIMTRGERVIANSEFIAQHIKQHYAIDPGRVRVIHRGIDLFRFDPAKVSVERVIALAQKWRLPDGVPVVMLPGRLTRWKGQALLIEAVSKLPDLEFVALMVGADQGREDYRRELEDLVKAKGLIGKAVVLDECDDMPAAYKLADVVVSASTDPEAFGRVVSEAQALGRPVVAADHGGAPEQILIDRTGFLFPPGDADALAVALRKALALSEGERQLLSAEAIAHVRKHFSKEQMCARTLALYTEIRRQRAYDRALQRLKTA
jgi:glycosyltransferase involved in cell wall biosynthesis